MLGPDQCRTHLLAKIKIEFDLLFLYLLVQNIDTIQYEEFNEMKCKFLIIMIQIIIYFDVSLIKI